MIKPFHSLLFLAAVAICIATVSFLFPDGKWQISENWSIQFIKFSDWIDNAPVSEEQKDVSQFTALAEKISTQQQLDDSLNSTELAIPDTLSNSQQDSLSDSSWVETDLPPLVFQDSLYTKPIEFADSIQQTALLQFFAALEQVRKSKELVRFLHIGDSQIEGDRITAYLRKKFQQQFGGGGIGLVGITEVNKARTTVHISATSNWKKYAIYGNGDKGTHNQYSVLHSFFRFTPPLKQVSDSIAQPDSVLLRRLAKLDTNDIKKARVTYKFFDKKEKYQFIKVFYRNPTAPFRWKCYLNDSLAFQGTVKKMAFYDYLQLSVEKPAQQVRIEIEANYSPDILGVAFDNEVGIALDNIPLRGSSGTEITKMSQSYLAMQLQNLNTKFIIMQFGVNIVPYQRAEYSFYEKTFYYQLQALKKAAPQADILVVGVSDMSKVIDGKYASYPNISAIREAQRNAAFKAGCAFWDLYEAMGGENAMISWVAAKPPLAAKDYTHFSQKGADVVAELLYNALMSSYKEYLTKTDKLKKKPS
jgi:lysophospholipase L1-like esterase